MQATNPKVSIGLAVYNGEEYLQEAIDSILAQTFTDFELIISDNASTDRTAEICQAYAAQDERVRYHRNPTNIGGANNENQTFKMSHGEYFRWAADDDICAPTLIEECVKILDQDPSVVLCYSKTALIDKDGNQIGKSKIARAESKRSYRRFRAIAMSKDISEQTYGLMRSEIVKKTELQKNYTNSDRVLLAELALYGKFHELPEYLFYKRIHPKNIYLNCRTRMAWFDPSYKGQIVFPWWMQLFDYIRTITQMPISKFNKMMCYLVIVEWIVLFGKHLVKDVISAIYMRLHSFEWRKKQYEITDNWS